MVSVGVCCLSHILVMLPMMVPLNSRDSCGVLGVSVLLLHSVKAVDTYKLTHIHMGTLFPSYY